MATLLLTAVGTAIGGPLGGAIGALIGRQVDGAIFGGRGSEGPRLNELTVQTSSYGAAIPRHFGKVRAAGTVIWATDLVEHKAKQGGGKGRPSVTTYTYTASFAVAVASRPIAGIGRIWADGNLLRGTAGDLKVGGQMRVHTGYGDQPVDSLIAQAEGTGTCPAFRETAYVVFEDLELAAYGNRLPSLTFEILADTGGTNLGAIARSIIDGAETSTLYRPLDGFSIDRGTAVDVLGVLSEAFPITCTAWGETLSLADGDAFELEAATLLPPPASSSDRVASGQQTGTSAQRSAHPRARSCGLRYYDIDRDYQPGMQRGRGRAEPGDLAVIELPAALAASDARDIADSATRRAVRPGESASYRTTELDSRFAPGRLVRIAGRSGTWRVEQWEWQAEGINLDLIRIPPRPAGTISATDSGRSNPAADLAAVPTSIAAFELPWDGTGAGDKPNVVVAASGETAGWTGAALLAVSGGGTFTSLGTTGRNRAVLGHCVNALPAASPLLFDSHSTLDVQLVGQDQELNDADHAQLCEGANRALVGSEIVQFGHAEPLGAGRWKLSQLLRGRGGTEAAVGEHIAGDTFVLLDDSLVPLDLASVADVSSLRILASGMADASPVIAAVSGVGATTRPLTPVHGSLATDSAGTARLRWIRRSRGAFRWLDHVDVPVNEQSESWEITYAAGTHISTWIMPVAELQLTSTTMAALPAGGAFEVRQIGSFGKSSPLRISITS